MSLCSSPFVSVKMSNFEEDKLAHFRGLPRGGENVNNGTKKKKKGNRKKVSDTDVVAQNREPTIQFREKSESIL